MNKIADRKLSVDDAIFILNGIREDEVKGESPYYNTIDLVFDMAIEALMYKQEQERIYKDEQIN